MNKSKIIIIGSGFGGIYSYLNLKNHLKSENLEVTLISKNNYFLFTPLLHEVATGSLSPHNVIQPIRSIIDEKVDYIEGEVTFIDLTKKEVKLNEKTLEYDYLILATGAQTNFYDTKISNSKIFELKDVYDACKIRNHIIDSFEKASSENSLKIKESLLTFVVIGAGATGVELFTEIHDYIFQTLYKKYLSKINKEEIKIYLINKAPIVLERFNKKLSVYAENSIENLSNVKILNGYEVKEIDNNKICLTGELKDLDIYSNNIYWVAGVKPSLPTIKGKINYLSSGRIEVEKTLNLKDYSEVFVIGDCAGDYPMLAQVAVRQAKTVVDNIILKKRKSLLKEFDYKIKAQLVSLGYKNAGAYLYGIFFHGFIAWFLWRTIYLFNFIYWDKRIKVATDWTISLFSDRDISKIDLKQ